MDSEEGVKTIRGRGRGRGRGGRGRGGRGGRARARGKKNVKCVPVVEMEVEDGENVAPSVAPQPADVAADHAHKQIDLEADISQLEAPTFTTLNRGPPEPMLRLQWDHRVNLVAEKVLNPMIHCCDQCQKPILIYGRMIPCKHVFCLACGKREDKVCPRCQEKVLRVEQTNLGTVFMCTHGGTRYNSAGCRRTYLSQRDLQAHINHRHVAGHPGGGSGSEAHLELTSSAKIPTMGGGGLPRHKPAPPPAADPRGDVHHRRTVSPPGPPFVPHRPPLYQGRTNLITVPLQDTGMDAGPGGYQSHYPPPQAPPPQYAPPYGVPPPQPPPPQFYPTPPSGYAPSGPPPQPPQYPPVPPARPPHYQDPMGQQYPPPPQWPHPHPPPNNGQQFYR